MSQLPDKPAATVGVAEHGNSAELVTLGPNGAILDRRRIDLTPPGTPTHPYHHEGAWAVGRYLDSRWARPIPLAEAVALVQRVHALAAEGATAALAALSAAIPMPIGAIAIRECPELPPTIEACIRDNRAQTLADSVMYRRALAGAAEARGWAVRWYDRDRVAAQAAAALIGADLGAALRTMGASVGSPWQARHKLAATAALAVLPARTAQR